MSHHRLLPIAAAGLGLFAATAAQACRCEGDLSPARAYERADAIVLGQVEKVDGDPEAQGGAMITLRPEMAWKAGVPASLKVETRTTCAYDFKAGQTYLVYLTRTGSATPYATGICNGNVTAAEAGKKLDWLKAHGKSVAAGN